MAAADLQAAKSKGVDNKAPVKPGDVVIFNGKPLVVIIPNNGKGVSVLRDKVGGSNSLACAWEYERTDTSIDVTPYLTPEEREHVKARVQVQQETLKAQQESVEVPAAATAVALVGAIATTPDNPAAGKNATATDAPAGSGTG